MGAIREFFGLGPSAGEIVAESARHNEAVMQGAQAYVQEGLMTALSIGLEDRNWIRTDGFARADAGQHLTFAAIQSAAENGSALVQGNPVMHRAAEAQAAYVWGTGVTFKGATNVRNKPVNKRVLFSAQAYVDLELAKIATGNVLILVKNDDTLQIIPFYEITGAIYDPEDSSIIRYFHRVWEETVTDFETMQNSTVTRKMLYPNMEFSPSTDGYPAEMGGVPVYQLGVIRHVAPHRLPGGAWGLPDLLAGIFYASEHKELIEAADSIFRAQSQYAVQYKGKTRKAVEQVAASIVAAPPLDPATGKPMQYGQTAAFGSDIEMQLMQKIGAGIDFDHFDPIAGLASVALGIPLSVVLGKEESETTLPFTTKGTMLSIQRMWGDVFTDIFNYMGKRNVKIFWPKIDPDPTFRQMQSIVGLAQIRLVKPEKVFDLVVDTFGTDWDATKDLSDGKEWDKFLGKKGTTNTIAAGSTEPGANNGDQITPGQGQTGKLGKLSDGDHSLRDQGQQPHTQK